jgi:hypothetical protein
MFYSSNIDKCVPHYLVLYSLSMTYSNVIGRGVGVSWVNHPSWLRSHGNSMYTYLCNQCLSPLHFVCQCLPLAWWSKACIFVDNCTATTTSVSMVATTTANSVLINSNTYNSCKYINIFLSGDPRGRDGVVVWLTFTCTISVKHR